MNDLERHGRDDDRPDQRPDLAEPRLLGLRRHEQPLRQPDAAGDGHAEQRGERHDAEAADLDGDEDHDEPGRRPVLAGGHDDQAGDGARGGGGEQRVDERRAVPARTSTRAPRAGP